MMKSLIFAILLIFSYTNYSLANLEPFLQCLSNRSSSSFPISEAIYTPNKSSELFQSVLISYTKNLDFARPETPKPLAIITAKHESHVQATILCAKSNGLQVRIRSGGHDNEGLSYVSSVPFVIIDLFNLRSITINTSKKTAWVQAGATMGELYYKIANTSPSLAFPGGVCPSLGAGGHISGGGYGNLIRKFGLSVDKVIDATIADVNGKILDRKSMGEDLFWAIRGGGGGSFGVILSWKLALVSIPPKVTVFKVSRTIKQNLTDIVLQWQDVVTKLPKEVFIRLIPSVIKAEGDNKIVNAEFVGMFLGQADKLFSMVNKAIPKLGLQQKDCLEMSWAESALFWYGMPVGTPINALNDRPKSITYYSKEKSDYIQTPIKKEGWEKIWELMMKHDKIGMQWNPYGGIMNKISSSATPFPHRRGNLFKVQYLISWNKETDKNKMNYVKSIREFYDEMAPYASKNPREAFLNYRDTDIGNNPSNETSVKNAEVYGHKYFKNNLRRLMKVKAKVDPDNFFKNEQSIPPFKKI